MTNFNPIRKWFWPGRHVRHNFDPGVFRVIEVDFEREVIKVLPENDMPIDYYLPVLIEYLIACCRPA